ncbi:hypothetical protein DPMN_012341 [Dreissena polymorpha]|uniref:Uncharacterized protein n=1 Tax=Dreissena polymorpha TaxID=45954 RepID=A0A9D4N6T1_DREPO|nr:hypothetical protein DPMN_012341 [Dreissena polymorpha]
MDRSPHSYGHMRVMPRLPYYSGKSEEWDAFWMQFQVSADSLRLNKEEFGTQLLLNLRGGAATFATGLDRKIIQDTDLLSDALIKRFGHWTPA